MSRDIRRSHGRSPGFSSLVGFAALTLLAFFSSASFVFSGEAVMHTITLSWDPSPTSAVIGYRLYFGQQSGSYPNRIDVGNRLSTDVANLIEGTTYYFAVTAYEADGSESVPSQEFHYLPNPPVLLNISTRAVVQPGDNAMIAGFIVGGIGQKKMAVRVLGPSLAWVGVHKALADPMLEIHGANGVLAANDNWQDSPNVAELYALNLVPNDPAEAAAIVTLSPGNYSVIVRGSHDETGVALLEVYDVGTP